jgi:spermidine synthase
VQQTESPFYHKSLIQRLTADITSLFPITRLYLASIPLYPGGLHCFTIGSKKYDPTEVDVSQIPDDLKTRYYNREIQKSCFALPSFVKELIK